MLFWDGDLAHQHLGGPVLSEGPADALALLPAAVKADLEEVRGYWGDDGCVPLVLDLQHAHQLRSQSETGSAIVSHDKEMQVCTCQAVGLYEQLALLHSTTRLGQGYAVLGVCYLLGLLLCLLACFALLAASCVCLC